MFEIFLTMCLQGQPELCADRLIPVEAETREICEAEAPARLSEWRKGLSDAVVSDWHCGDGALADALNVTEVAAGVFVHQGRYETPTPANAGDLANVG